jgi:hypothetical protein
MRMREILTAFEPDDLETLLIIARNGQSGRIGEWEVRVLVEAYKNLLQHHPTEEIS